jgi:heptosyltransferase II
LKELDVTGIKKILAIKLCCIGDIIQATPALRALKANGAEVHFLCNEWVSDLVDMIPFVSKKFVINTKNPVNVLKTISLLRKEKYDLVVNFHRNVSSNLFAAALGAKYRAGFDWNGKGVFLTHKIPFLSNEHEGMRYLSVVEALGYKRQGIHTEIKAPEMPSAKGLIGKLKAGLFPGGGKNPGTVMVTKRWPAENFVKLAQELDKKDFTVYFFGGEIDKDVISDLESRIPNLKKIMTKDLKELAYYIAEMDVFVAGDTGPLHMSAALGTPTVGLFGPSSPLLVGPPGGHVINIWKQTDCGPCYEPETVHLKEFLECKDNKCMQAIGVDEVADAVETLAGKNI